MRAGKGTSTVGTSTVGVEDVSKVTVEEGMEDEKEVAKDPHK